MSHESVDSSSHSESTSYSASGGVSLGFWSAGGGAQHTSTDYSQNLAISSFSMKFDLTQVVISRPWFYPEFFMSRGWTLRKGEGWTFEKMPSDGKQLPNTDGLFIAYPTTLLFIRNLEIVSAEFASAYTAYSNSTSGSTSVGWGPFTLSGSYGHSESGNHYHSEANGARIAVPGMQIIGFVNHLIGKSPNPLPELKDKDFH